MIWKLPRPLLGVVAFLLVWVAGATFIGFGIGLFELIGLAFLASVAFVGVNTVHGQRRRIR